MPRSAMISPSYYSDPAWTGGATATARGTSGVVALLTFAHPLGFCLFAFGFSQFGRFWLLATLLGACIARGPTFSRELKAPLMATLAGLFVLAFALATHLGSAAFAVDFVRLALAGVYFAGCLLAFRGAVDLRPLGRGLAVTALVFLAASLPSVWAALRDRGATGTLTLYEHKETLSTAPGFHINPNLPLILCALWFIAARLRPARAWMFGAALLSVGFSWFVGVRATFLGAALALLVLLALQLVPASRRAWAPVALALILAPLGFAALPAANRMNDTLYYEVDAFLSGRLTLWTAAWNSWIHRPLWGSGPESWPSQLAIHLPSAHEWREQSSLALETGGFHNALLQLLAERGVLVGLLYLAAVAAVVLCAGRILQARPGHDATDAAAIPFAFLSLVFVFRAPFEISGFLGYYKGPVDYLCTLLFAVTLMKGCRLCRETHR